MPPFWGANTAQLRSTASATTTAEGRLRTLLESLSGTVGREDIWTGQDARNFRDAYFHGVLPLATRAVTALADRSRQLDVEADEQDSTSLPEQGVPMSTDAHLLGATSTLLTSGSNTMGFWDHRGDERSGRRGEGRENTPRNDGDPDQAHDSDNPNAQYATPGPPATAEGDTGLGDGVPGTDATAPDAPAWTPPADGAGEYNSEFGGLIDHSVHSLAREGADLKRGDWPNASEHLDHFLDNTGEDYQADVDSLLSDEAALAQTAEERRHRAGHDAVAQAQASGAAGPITYPLSTGWEGHTASDDWFYASGSFNYNQTGTVTAYPPDGQHPEWRYEVDSRVNFRDRYNWDGNKSTDIMGVNVSDEKLAALHRAGLAREYNLVGESSAQHSEGTVP